MHGFGKRIVYGLVAFVAIVGLKFFHKSTDHSDIKERLAAICGEDSNCSSAVENKFEECFEAHYQIKRRSSGLNENAFLNCFNDEPGGPFFTMQTAEHSR